jgi:uncharacterized protein YcbK (DUF882 family)
MVPVSGALDCSMDLGLKFFLDSPIGQTGRPVGSPSTIAFHGSLHSTSHTSPLTLKCIFGTHCLTACHGVFPRASSPDHAPKDGIVSQQSDDIWSRRFFLKSSLAGMLVLGSRLVSPDSASARLLPEGRLSLYNTHTDEHLRVRYRTRSGHYDREALHDINYLLRCHHSNQVCPMDIQLLEFVNQVEKLVGPGQDIHIYSAYRSRSYNNLLVRLGRGAVPNSRHIFGQAVDFSIPGVPLPRIRHAAVKLQLGGVGYYRQRGFIHLDTGPVRYW